MPNPLLENSSKRTKELRSLPPRPRHQFIKEVQSLGYEKVIGIDEVGRGALAGPIVVAAVEIYQPIAGVHDSKLLTYANRKLLSEQITLHARQVCFGQASNLEIDKFGLSAAQALAYQRCLGGMTFDLVLTDFYALKHIKHLKAVRGDQLFYPVAAASIVAKVFRDQLMTVYHQFHSQYGWQRNAGYGTSQHKTALDAIGSSPLHRQSFL